ncbi:MAG: hypothetical protein COU11_01730 [Candidatus Harrisonbacteria bacterium CG10_big_fil_rev_8_21_14_0_10_49_15]|uniref:Uncharacterized protein n=1 Tax=Candidatus Harrisonbacteria bacterium CG10_big_fil_rev_8_21_14_0_10_49_15 TaxID=1974587 RepID=A0A2H0UL98_9BACT|nr:MAG: hypothetical protein COU11_01730 [Candidatus Harrisonbacteria bacterium CG10_big_fil_rev_8_21_14_0_10_49_15]
MRSRYLNIPVIILLFAAVVGAQLLYDQQELAEPKVAFSASPATIRSLDLGLHSAVASLFWIEARLDILRLSQTNRKYLDRLAIINHLDPKLATPYAFTVLVLPTIKSYPNGLTDSLEIGERGVAHASPDWRIPFYLATNYHLELSDNQNAAKYFDIAANTPGAPSHIRRFSENYLVLGFRDQTKQIWQTIFETAKDQEIKDRAHLYLARIAVIETLEEAAQQYQSKFGALPQTVDDLITGGILTEIPEDPAGYQYGFNEEGRLKVIE